ncbi:MAG TPA: hypothetical protein VH120_19320, partial [Gemmataceae bacterium]|nr:hypothetical protein [Gemmataceae bacterium]
GEGPATLASRLMRAELVEQNKGGWFQRTYNHPVTLLLMLAACVGLIVWGLNRKKATPEELYAAAEPLMQSDQPADWRRAWIDYLEPLTSDFPENPHREEIATFQRKMQDVDRLDKALKQASTEAPRSEAERFYRMGLADVQNGDTAGAKRVWENLARSFGGLPAEHRWVELAQRGLTHLGEPSSGERFASAREALAEARKLRDGGKPAEAERIWDGLETLYRNEPGADPIVSEIKRDRGR